MPEAVDQSEQESQVNVLIVEDDPAIKNLLLPAFENCGVPTRVTWVTSAEEAIECIVRSHASDNPVDFVAADIHLEGEETGVDLWQYCERNYPDMLFLMMSGTLLDKIRFSVKLYSPMRNFLAKPFSVKQATEAIQTLLRGGTINPEKGDDSRESGAA